MKTYIIPIQIEALAIISAKNRYKAVRKVASKKHKFKTEIINYQINHKQIKACDKEKIFKKIYDQNQDHKTIKYLLVAPDIDINEYKN